MKSERGFIFICPNNNPAEAKAVRKVVDYLQAKRKIRKGQGKITGYTQTRSLPSVVEGYWWSTKSRKWVHDNLILIIVDHEFLINDSHLHAEVESLKKTISQFYEDEGSKQEEIWIATHPVWRYD